MNKIKSNKLDQLGIAHLLLIAIIGGVVTSIIATGIVVNAHNSPHKLTTNHQLTKTSQHTTTAKTSASSTSNSTPPTSKPQASSSSKQSSSTPQKNSSSSTSSPTTAPSSSTPAAPSVTIDTPANGATLTMGADPADQYIHYVCTDIAPAGYNGMKIRVTGPGGTEYYSYTKPASDDICNDGFYATDSTDMPNGTYTITITLYDLLGRTATATNNFYLQW